MKKIVNLIKNFVKQESAATSVEYAIILAMIIAACVAGITVFGGSAQGTWFSNADQIADAMNN